MNEMFQNIPISNKLDQTVKYSIEQIYIEEKRNKMKKAFLGVSSVAATFAAIIMVCMANPTLASKLPLLGNIFELMQNDVTFSGDYEEIGDELGPVYTQYSNGVTITLSETYCNSDALYISMQVTSEEAFADTHDFECFITVSDKLRDNEVAIAAVLEGDFIDEYTYAGVLRLEHKYWNIDSATDNHLQISINEITAPLKNNEGSITFIGPWNFTLDICTNTQDTQTIMINEWNEEGVGIEKIVKDRFEIVVYDSYKGSNTSAAFIPIILDAEGKMLENGSDNTRAIESHNISTIDVFLMDWDHWMDIKGIYWNMPAGYWDSENALTEDGKTLKEFLMTESVYHKEIDF